MIKHIFFTKNIQKYKGEYVAVVKGKVVATGKDAKSAYAAALKLRGINQVEGVYYVPQKKDLLTALCASRITK